jgi:hypothetical protein
VETVADVVTQLTSAQAHGFDVKEGQAEIEVQAAVKRVAAASQWIKAQLELGPTISGQSSYVLPDTVVRLFDLIVGENTPYGRRDLRTLWDLRAGRSELLAGEEGGIFAESFSADGKTKSFEVFPAPEESDVLIQGLASIVPADLGPADPIPFPQQYRSAVLDFAVAALYEKADENPQQASAYEGRALKTAESLYLLGNARAGSGPWKIPVAGHRRR